MLPFPGSFVFLKGLILAVFLWSVMTVGVSCCTEAQQWKAEGLGGSFLSLSLNSGLVQLPKFLLKKQTCKTDDGSAELSPDTSPKSLACKKEF